MCEYFNMYNKVVFVVLLTLGCARSESESDQYVELAPEVVFKLTQYVVQCFSESGADPSIVFQIKDKKYDDNEIIKKFFFCSFKKTGISSDEGDIDVDQMLRIYPEKANKVALRKVIEECSSDNGTEPMDKTLNFFRCFQEKTPVRIKLV